MPKPTRPSRASMPNRRALGATLAALAIVLAGSATAAGAGWTSYLVRNPAATLVHLNALRRSYGATPVQLVQGWSTGCANHMRYLQRNRVITHGEQRRMPDYTAAGAMAGSTSVLSVPGTEPFPSDQPLGIWAQAPYHQSQVLEPLMRRTGFANGCMNTLRGVQFVATSARARHARPHLVVWPGQNATGVPSSVDACDELPRNPFAAVGWRCNRQGTAFYAYTLDRRRPRRGDGGQHCDSDPSDARRGRLRVDRLDWKAAPDRRPAAAHGPCRGDGCAPVVRGVVSTRHAVPEQESPESTLDNAAYVDRRGRQQSTTGSVGSRRTRSARSELITVAL